MAQDKKPPKEKPLDEDGLDPNVRNRILSYGAPDRRRPESPNDADTKDRRRRDDEPDELACASQPSPAQT